MLRHLARVNGRLFVVTQGTTSKTNATFREIAENASRLACAIACQGVFVGDSVATLMSSPQKYAEAHLDMPYRGAIPHASNMRLDDSQIGRACSEMRDKAFLPNTYMILRILSMAPLPRDQKFIVCVGQINDIMRKDIGGPLAGYGAFLAERDVTLDSPAYDERNAAIARYAGGATEVPKGARKDVQ